MKTTPFHELHIAAEAKMGEFANFNMPLFYSLGVMKEHLHTREQAGLFDISHMVHVQISGAEASKFISRVCPYDASSQTVGQARYSYFLNETAGIIDDLIVTRLADDRFLIVANAGCAEKDIAHIKNHAAEFNVIVDILPRAFLALQGPKAEDVLAQHFSVSHMAFLDAVEPEDGWLVSRSGYTGEDGFEIAMPPEKAIAFANALLSDERVEWIGLGARDSLRLEAGLPLYGQDLDENTSPHEAGLLWAIPKELREGGGFVGADALAQKIVVGRTRMRIGLVPDGRPVRGGTDLKNTNGETIGTVTSGGFGPSLGGPMALALVEVAAADASIFADVRGKLIPMERTKTPFVPHSYKR